MPPMSHCTGAARRAYLRGFAEGLLTAVALAGFAVLLCFWPGF